MVLLLIYSKIRLSFSDSRYKLIYGAKSTVYRTTKTWTATTRYDWNDVGWKIFTQKYVINIKYHSKNVRKNAVLEYQDSATRGPVATLRSFSTFERYGMDMLCCFFDLQLQSRGIQPCSPTAT